MKASVYGLSFGLPIGVFFEFVYLPASMRMRRLR